MRNGEPQKLLGSGEGALVLNVHRGGAHKGWKGAGPQIIGPGGSSPVPITEGSSVGGQGEASHARVGHVRRSHRRSCPRSVWRRGDIQCPAARWCPLMWPQICVV